MEAKSATSGASWQEVEWLKLTVIVDNQTDMLSDPPGCCKGAACTTSRCSGARFLV